MANTTAQKLRLSVRQMKELQAKHGISNLLAPEGKQIANVEVMADIYFEGSRKWPNAPTREVIEDMEIPDVAAAIRAMYTATGEAAEGNS